MMNVMTPSRMVGTLALAAALCAPGMALAQSGPAASSLKTIGAPAAAAKSQIVPSLFVLNSRGATLQGDTLTLTGVMPHSIIFADRPVRSAGHQLTSDIIADWGAGDDSFTKNPPNATISVFGKDGAVKDAVVVLKSPKLDGDKLTFNVQTLEGDLSGAARRSAERCTPVLLLAWPQLARQPMRLPMRMQPPMPTRLPHLRLAAIIPTHPVTDNTMEIAAVRSGETNGLDLAGPLVPYTVSADTAAGRPAFQFPGESPP
jgi:hypothetical protein